jgi:ribosomal protein L37AE/L43A
MMKLSIARCSNCKRIRLVDKSTGVYVCFACKHLVKKGK